MPERNWGSDPIDVQYLLDSGLLFKINQTVLHLFGVAVKVELNSAGEKVFGFVDSREQPENMTFPESVFEAAEAKYQKFRQEFGGGQINRRQHALGSALQNYSWTKKQ